MSRLTNPTQEATLEALRTPDQRFADLPDYPFAPHHSTVGKGLRLHYVDRTLAWM